MIEGISISVAVITMALLAGAYLKLEKLISRSSQQKIVNVAVTGRLKEIETFCNKLGTSITELISLLESITKYIEQDNSHGVIDGVYKTLDGKYTANSIDELIRKIRNDDGSDSSELTQEDIDKMRKMFEDEDKDDGGDKHRPD